jgi:hypothetical protein
MCCMFVIVCAQRCLWFLCTDVVYFGVPMCVGCFKAVIRLISQLDVRRRTQHGAPFVQHYKALSPFPPIAPTLEAEREGLLNACVYRMHVVSPMKRLSAVIRSFELLDASFLQRLPSCCFLRACI